MPLKKASHFRAVLKRLDNTLNSRDHIFTETMHLELEDQREEGENIAVTRRLSSNLKLVDDIRATATEVERVDNHNLHFRWHCYPLCGS